jgi:hypothetical protein
MQMSYADKNQDNNKRDQVHPAQQEEAKSSLTEATQQPEPKEQESPKLTKSAKKDTLPVGMLKWSKEDELVQDTHLNLDKSGAVDREQDYQSPDNKQSSVLPLAQKSVAAGQEGQSALDEPVQADQSPAPNQAERNLSLEDTLTPIDFKEYSLTPVDEADKEPEIQYKQPAYTVDFSEDIAKADESGQEAASKSTEHVSKEEKRGKYTEEVKGQDEADARPAWKKVVKIVWLPVSLLAALIIGLIVGHAVIGKQPAGDVFDMDMWQHIYKLIFKT